VFAEHSRYGAKLLVAGEAASALAAGGEVMQTDSITARESGDAFAEIFDRAGNLVTERQREGSDWRDTGPVMSI
jgi:hypothetical protein